MDSRSNTIKCITSPDNLLIRDASRLKQRKYRDKEDLYLIEGPHLTEEALATGAAVSTVFLRASLLQEPCEETERLLSKLIEKNLNVISLPENLFDKLSETDTPQGLLAIVAKRQYSEEAFFSKTIRADSNNFLIFDKVQDPGNVGTMIRTADAAGFSGIVVVKGTADVYAPKVVRAASGSLFRMPLFFVNSPSDGVALMESHGKKLVATMPDTGELPYQADLANDIALVIGNEGNGISREFRDAAAMHLRIPMQDGVESLNAAVAAGILMFESVRQRTIK